MLGKMAVPVTWMSSTILQLLSDWRRGEAPSCGCWADELVRNTISRVISFGFFASYTG